MTDTGVHGRRPDPSIPAEPAPPIAGGGLGDYQSRGQHDQQEHSTSHEHSAEGKQKHGHVGLAGFEAKLPHSVRPFSPIWHSVVSSVASAAVVDPNAYLSAIVAPQDTPHNSLDGVGGGYGAGVAGKHDGFNFKNRDTSTHDPTLEHSSHQYQHHGHSDHSTPPSGAGAGVGAAGAGVGAGVTHTGTGTGTGSSTHQEPHKKASIVDKVVGGAEVLVGKVTKDTAMVEEGQARKTGVQTHNAAALNKEGAPHAHGEGHTVHKDEAPRGAAGFGSSGTSGAH